MELRSNLTEFSRLIFGADTSCKQARKFWEPSSPTTQCNNVPITGHFKDGIVCYICGMKINKVAAAAGAAANESNTDDSDDIDENGKDGRNPECEHILPIGLAIIYLGLYSPTFKDRRWYNKDILKYEYAWAHRTCNQIKSDESFITVNKDNTAFGISKKNLIDFLGRIWNTTRNDSKEFKTMLHGAYNDNFFTFVENRIGSLSSQDASVPSLKKFTDITNLLNMTGVPPGLVLLAGTCCALEGNLKSKEGQQKQRCSKDPAQVEKIRQEKTEEMKNKWRAIYDKYITKKYKDISHENKEYYVEIMIRLPSDQMNNWIQFIKNKIDINSFLIEINKLQKSTNRLSPRSIERLLENVKKLEEENILLDAVNNAATIVTAEKNLLKDAWVLLPEGKTINNVNTTDAAKILDKNLQNLHTISLSSNSSNTNMLNRGAAGPHNRGAAEPHNRGAAGPNRGAAGPNNVNPPAPITAWMRGLNSAGQLKQKNNATRRAAAAARLKQARSGNTLQQGDAKKQRHTGGRKTCKRKSRKHKYN